MLKFAKDRQRYRQRLRGALTAMDASLLTYNITSNHVHLIAYAAHADQISDLMQQAAGEFARDYNQRKERSGAFWEGRYHATMVNSGEYLWKCIKYVELNMVRCGAVRHPREWEWSGYGEIIGWRRRNRLLDLDRLLRLGQATSIEEFRENFNVALDDALINDQLRRQERWTEAIAVGSRAFVNSIEERIENRPKMETTEEAGVWLLREDHSAFSESQKPAIGLSRPSVFG